MAVPVEIGFFVRFPFVGQIVCVNNTVSKQKFVRSDV